MIKSNSTFLYKEKDDGSFIISLEGEIDHHSAVSVRQEIDELLLEKRPKRVYLDLSHISFMDSSGLGLIMGRYALLKDLGGTMILLNPALRVQKILNLAGMERIIKIEKSGKGEEKK